MDRRVLRENRNAALAFEVGVIHDALRDGMMDGAERTALPQERIDERGLAVIDVGDDGNVAPQRVGDLPRLVVNRHLISIGGAHRYVTSTLLGARMVSTI